MTARSSVEITRKERKQGTVQTNGVEANSRTRKFKELRQYTKTGENMRRIMGRVDRCQILVLGLRVVTTM
ncbi:hypothetical protein BWQ96_05932 [Gracilariopsis chorda]|uniref:Uncharacterized protein n=1 Tax=Gracilariopsis chorda TaxID=448386 RepID=A0A2V3IQD3_9FLOR|nr:hypothetical protein BWQ96_05932 [Gracilariopsis chorda]|eukprot:PXF44305.1 hypothetical protein BWQ96_05932 [Gracilariopsis chorda]